MSHIKKPFVPIKVSFWYSSRNNIKVTQKCKMLHRKSSSR